MIPLYNLNEIGIIIPMKIGNTYTNQVGGSACFHASATGIYIPLGEWSGKRKDPFLGLSEFPYDENKVKGFLKEYELWKILETYPTEDKKYYEGWVWARIKRDIKGNMKAPPGLRAFAGILCVVAYPNSD